MGWPLLLAVGLVTAGFIIITITLAMRIRHQAVTTGVEQMLGQLGEVLVDFEGTGQVRVGGEIWQAESDQSLQKGEQVVVRKVSGLCLSVEREN